VTDEGERRAALMLLTVPGLQRSRLARLLLATGSAAAAVEALARNAGQKAALRSAEAGRRVDHAMRVLDRMRVKLLTVLDPAYPIRAAAFDARPAMLFAQGNLELFAGSETVAVVGTRKPTTYGLDVAGSLAGDLARLGVVVCSGLARGVDGAAHRGALEVGGHTLAVLGCGIDISYPREHRRLQQRIGEEGLLVSEFLPGDPPLPHHFLQRNVTIAVLSDAVVVVEGGRRSGSLRTADYGLELGRDVLAVPGPIGRAESEGPNLLLAQGARPALSAGDVVEEMRGLLGPAVQPPTSTPTESGEAWHRTRQKERDAIAARITPPVEVPVPSADAPWLEQLGRGGKPMDQIVATFEDGAGPAAARLLELELQGVVQRLPGGRYRRAERNRQR
jgi:DNA processing protein